VHGTQIWFLAMAIVAAFGVLSAAFFYLRKRRKERPRTMPAGWQETGIQGGDEAGGESVETAAQKMGKLQRKHESGSIDDAEFEVKKNALEQQFMAERGLR
jgi:LPXTG-motif cell wall-anchored protein